MARSRNRKRVKHAIGKAAFILFRALEAKRNFNPNEWQSLIASSDAVAKFGNVNYKTLFFFILYIAVEKMRDEPNPNSTASNNCLQLELYFRSHCSPLFDKAGKFEVTIRPSEEDGEGLSSEPHSP